MLLEFIYFANVFYRYYNPNNLRMSIPKKNLIAKTMAIITIK